ncbi:alpha/beta fold hydrolase [Salinibacterium sp. PAMC 21357]|uniref:alpha/beta fold hydrolase n=1 Tax=Salinibacterium sp. PAMC 21357 TaxID=1112215 RepID=UPI000287AB01|nr:alpha/beta hydrolase [Salinibacterium sp. PAMC 21357]
MPSYEGSDGATLHYDVVGGETEPIILLAGGAARHPSYLGDLAGLGERHQLIVPHLRGVGRTAMPVVEQRGSYWNQAEDIERLRIHLGLERLVLAAHSAGTRLAIAYAAQFAPTLARMVLITPPATYLVGEASDADVLSQKRQGDLVFESAFAALAAGPLVTDDAGYNAWQQQTAPAGYANWGAEEQAHALVGGWNLAAAKAYFSVSPPTNLALRLGDIEAPVLVLAGAEDCLTGLAPVVALAGLFPSGVAEVIERSGHYPWVEQPLAFRRAIDTFLED